MNKREAVLSIFDANDSAAYTPAAFFLHFGVDFQRGDAAVRKHLEYFRATDMDFVKIQYEHPLPIQPDIQSPEDWSKLPVFDEAFFEPPLTVLKGLVKEAGRDALIVQTLYSAFMIACQMTSADLVERHIRENPTAFAIGMQAINASLVNFVRAAIRVGADGFYASTQGGEAQRFKGLSAADAQSLFNKCIRPFDLELMTEANHDTAFNILHVCDYHLPYENLNQFVDYPGQVVNCNLEMMGSRLSAKAVADLFGRPFMGGMDRLGILAKGTPAEVRAETERVLKTAPESFILAADCTVPANTPWDNLKTAIQTAHRRRHV